MSSTPKISEKKAQALREWIGENPVRRLIVACIKPGTEWTPNEAIAKATGASKGTINEALRDLQKLRLGEFRYGRRGMPSRFQWAVESGSVAAVAQQMEQVSPVPTPPPAPEPVMDEIKLSSGRVVLVPKGMTQVEFIDLMRQVSSMSLRAD